jgi:chorismate mutase
MTPNRCVLPVAVALALAVAAPQATAHAEPASPLYRLVDTAAQRLATSDSVAAFKWINGGPVTDSQRAGQVLDAVGADATAHGIDPQYVRAIFTDQIDATEGIQYTRFGQWKFDPPPPPPRRPTSPNHGHRSTDPTRRWSRRLRCNGIRCTAKDAQRN